MASSPPFVSDDVATDESPRKKEAPEPPKKRVKWADEYSMVSLLSSQVVVDVLTYFQPLEQRYEFITIPDETPMDIDLEAAQYSLNQMISVAEFTAGKQSSLPPLPPPLPMARVPLIADESVCAFLHVCSVARTSTQVIGKRRRLPPPGFRGPITFQDILARVMPSGLKDSKSRYAPLRTCYF
jgi:hypothetical protein